MFVVGTFDKLCKYHEDMARLATQLRGKLVNMSKLECEVKGAKWILLLCNSKLIGMLRYFPITSQFLKQYKLDITNSKFKSAYQISTVIIDNDHRRKGYGKKLIRKAALLKKKLILDTYLSWKPAVNLYLSCGFQLITSHMTHNDALVVLGN
jgi:GNAT superfamily N-acetyltransferase